MKNLKLDPRNSLAVCALGGSLVLGAAGCGRAATVTTHPVGGASGATAVPAGASEFASLSSPLLSGAVGESKSLLSHMQHDPVASLGTLCTSTGTDLSNDESAFQSLYAPGPTHSFRTVAIIGFKLVLAAAEECGMAVDQGSKHQMKEASLDMVSGLKSLQSATAMFDKWAAVR